MDWLLRWIGENWGPLMALLAFPVLVWAELLNHLPFGRERDKGTKR